MCADPPDTAARAPLAVPSMAAADGLELGGGLVPRGAAGLGRLKLRTGAVQPAPKRSDAKPTSGVQDTYKSLSDINSGGYAGASSGVVTGPEGVNPTQPYVNTGLRLL